MAKKGCKGKVTSWVVNHVYSKHPRNIPKFRSEDESKNRSRAHKDIKFPFQTVSPIANFDGAVIVDNCKRLRRINSTTMLAFYVDS